MKRALVFQHMDHDHPGRFLDYFKVNALGLIPATDYDRAVDALEAKRAK